MDLQPLLATLSTTRILVWGDGYYNGAIKTRKTVQPMEVTAEEASLQRSQQLRELYDSLSVEEANQPARRPCAALSPEDLTESEWFYLMSVSFSFPPGVSLPGKAFARQQHVWLLGANEADSKVFSRAILAKSAGVQTVVCLPLMDGVVELGTTERVEEDLGLIQHVKAFFIHHHHPNPALSEHSTSNPTTTTTTTSNHSRFPSQPLLAVYSSVHPPTTASQDNNDEDEEEEEDDDEEEEDDDDNGAQSNSEVETGRIGHQEPLQIRGPVVQDIVMAQPSELMQLDMSEDIRLGSPDDGSNHLESDLQLVVVSQPDLQNRPESTRRWPLLPYPLDYNGLQPPVSEGLHQMEELTEEDTHYSQTVSTILQQSSTNQWSESSAIDCVGYSPQSSAFSKWSFGRSDHLPVDGASQWLLKCVLFSVPFLHNKYRSDENSPRFEIATRLPKCASQDEMSANHVLAERRRREKLNERFIVLRSLVPFVTKMDKASILGDTIEYVKQLRRRIQDLESTSEQIDGDQRSGGPDAQKIGGPKEERITMQDQDGSDRRKIRVVEGIGGAKAKVVDGAPIVGNVVQVSIIESDALLELKCGYREGILLEIMQSLRELRMEITAVQSSSSNGVFAAELRAKVKESSSGRKVTIVEVKRVIHQIISQY